MEYISKRAGLEDHEREVKTEGRNISNICYADDSILIAQNANDLEALISQGV